MNSFDNIFYFIISLMFIAICVIAIIVYNHHQILKRMRFDIDFTLSYIHVIKNNFQDDNREIIKALDDIIKKLSEYNSHQNNSN